MGSSPLHQLSLPIGPFIGPRGLRFWGLGIRVQGLGVRVQGLGTRVQGLGFRDWSLGIRDQGLGIRVQGLGIRVQGLEFRDQGLGFRDQGLSVKQGSEEMPIVLFESPRHSPKTNPKPQTLYVEFPGVRSCSSRSSRWLGEKTCSNKCTTTMIDIPQHRF